MATIEPNFESICINPNDDLVLYKKEIVRSRIEKFLYAICSLDTDDLPTPLSRIEELYNCLVTGEDIPTFTPLSRAEKFVMAMLGAYDVELLPTPISRSETLMKKIATGDNNLDDVDNLQSRYEFLLAYIIKAGGFNGGSGDFYYELTSLTSGFTTIYDTFDMPVKSAILKGQTLKNITDYNIKADSNVTIEADGTITITAKGTYTEVFLPALEKLPSTKYWVGINVIENTLNGDFVFHATTGVNCIFAYSATITQGFVGVKEQVRTTMADVSSAVYAFRSYLGSKVTEGSIKYKVMVIPYQEGMENWGIPYFTDMQSVKMPVLTTTGKNLFDSSKIIYNKAVNGSNPTSLIDSTNRNTLDYTSVIPNERIIVSGFTVSAVYAYDENKNYIERVSGVSSTGGLLSANTHFIRIAFDNTIDFSKAQIEYGTQKTEYEPHKTNILTVNEPVELRGIGEVKDELNLVTGELIQRIGAYTFTGDEPWFADGPADEAKYFILRAHYINPPILGGVSAVNLPLICNRLPTIKFSEFTMDNGGINFTYDLRMNFTDCNCNQGATAEDLKAYLKANPTTIYYPIAEVVKTVDLSTLDQDGKETKLSTFDDITHVTVSSEGLIPTGDIDIARPIQFVDYSLDNSLTTLYNTIDYPVKSAILKGNTLVNIAQQYSKFGTYTGDVNFDGEFFSYTKPTTVTSGLTFKSIYGNFEIGKQISIYVNNQSDVSLYLYNSSYGIKGTFEKGVSSVLFTTDSDSIRIGLLNNSIEANIKVSVMMFEGDCTNCEVPYFTGMQSVKMPVLTTYGKNLFDVSRHGSLTPQPTGDIQLNSAEWGKYDVKYILKPNMQYTLTILGDGTKCWIAIVVDGSSQSSNVETSYTKTFSTNSNGEVTIGIYANTDKYVGYSRKSISIEEGTVSTPYEPYKSNILTCNEEVELRGIGDVKDELNLLTGELTQRIGEVVFDGSSDELWSITTNNSGFKRFVSTVTKTYSNYSEITNWLPTENKSYWSLNENGFYIGANGRSVIVFNTNDSRYNMSITEFENYLSQNPLIVQYPLIESVKTVDLSTVNQNNEETELSTFDDITHVTVSSEGLVPTGDITVATKNATDVIDAGVMSLRMDDISNSQRTLKESVNAQSDDIDVTMLGATDIYEQLL